MNIAIILLNRGRGSGEVARAHVRHLLVMGHKVYFLFAGNNNEIEGAVNIDVKLHSDITPVHEYLPSAGNKQRQVASMGHQEMMKYVEDYKKAVVQIVDDVDVFITHHVNLNTLAVSEIALDNNVPYIVFAHGTGIESRIKGLWDDANWNLIAQAVESAHGLIVTTKYVKNSLILPLLNIPEEKFLILPCGVNLQKFSPQNTDNIRAKYNLPEEYVICPGALTFSKGPQNVVEASKEYYDIAPTVFIGEGDMHKELEDSIEDRGVFLGYVSSEDKAQLINAATLLVAAPEKEEHFGIIYAEGLAGGTPCVAYKGGGVDSIVTPMEGILTERNPGSLGKKVKFLLLNSGQRRQMSASCRARAESHFDYNNLVKKLYNWIENIIQ